jgi:hypothetical protein
MMMMMMMMIMMMMMMMMMTMMRTIPRIPLLTCNSQQPLQAIQRLHTQLACITFTPSNGQQPA